MRAISFLILMLLPGVLMADIFYAPPTDKSIEFLGKIFGSDIGSVHLGGTPNVALQHMFQIFNVAIISIAITIVSYIGIVSTINTAQEGKTMGRKYASIWIPLRAVLGMLVLVPTPTTGYSVIQVSVMWFILQGVGVADNLWNSILGDLSSGIAISTQNPTANVQDSVLKNLYIQGQELTESVLRSAVCMASFNAISSKPSLVQSPPESQAVRLGRNVRVYTVKNVNEFSSADKATVTGTMYVGVPGDENFADVCGKYTIVGSVSKDDWDSTAVVTQKEIYKKALHIYKEKEYALLQMFVELGKLSVLIVDQQTKPRDINNRLVATDEQRVQPEGYRNRAIEIYTARMLTLIRPQRITELQDIVRQGTLSGWISAGAFYFALNQSFELKYFADMTAPPVASAVPRCDDPASCTLVYIDRNQTLNAKIRNFVEYNNEKSFLATRLWDSKIYLDNDITLNVEQLDIGTGVDDESRSEMRQFQTEISKDMRELLLDQDLDPLISISKFGSKIMIDTEQAIIAMYNKQEDLVYSVAAGQKEYTSEISKQIALLTSEYPGLIALFSIVWLIGASLAIYVPLIPFMMFTGGVLGWFLLVIEAIVAAPILALAFIQPSGEELGKTMQGLMLLLNILLRPALMLFGFVLASRLYKVIVEFVNFSMISNFANLGTAGSIMAWVVVLTIYAAFVIALANKCFALIYGLPDKILRWMGGAPEHTDISQEMHQTKAGMEKGGQNISGVGKGLAERQFHDLAVKDKQLQAPDQVRGGPDNNQ